ncbi:type II secretion system F family protein [Candidatus Liberibacter americanus]|uniref:Flp pilus assembly protein TadB n=1 Tax=Candidatus Liberibacter americanus str. Sao Paulo TaxID=1261131 RepID=U6B4Q1_9HYPH|nr:type II secretion system F family protein [Candidatus Liberibacter americanus]AHA27603.1 Flp pilus assembly protein TadB [Candidatus Liberibacter americanus str. Sao Paulo]EMS36311.1 pilus assembly protein [Candidatus Liberibacter americanus PW_SP]
MDYIFRVAFIGLIVLFVFIIIYKILFYIFKDEDDDSIATASRIQKKSVKNKGDDLEASKRRKALLEAMQKIEMQQKEKSSNNIKLSALISYSGLSISKKSFYIISAIFGFIVWIFALILVNSFFISVCISLSSVLIFPRMLLKIIIKKRKEKFLNEFPNALDIVVRSVRSGLPVSDAIAIIVSQSSEPVKSEFRRVVEAQQLGLSVSESVARMLIYMPLQEVSFFSTVITIQSQSGGNLSESLSNLSKVLRDRKKMKAKVQALAMEAKASAWIIGSLPFIVSLLVYFTSPDYMSILFTDTRGHIILGFAACMMLVGVLIMRFMINFDV